MPGSCATRIIDSVLSFCAVLRGWVAHLLAPLTRARRLVRLRSQVQGRIPLSTQFDGPVTAQCRGRLVIGEHCRIGPGVHFEVGPGAVIALGHHVRLNAGTQVVANQSIEIGNDVLIGEYVSLRDTNHGTAPGSLMRCQDQSSAPIRIGDDVWLGRGVVVLKGVQIGEGAVVGANSVVTRNVPPGAIAVGVPARQIACRRVAAESAEGMAE